jgi:hypothetical protein
MLLRGGVSDHGRCAVETIEAIDAGQPVIERVAQAIDDGMHPRHGCRKVNGDLPGAHAVRGGPSGLMGHRSAGAKRLGGLAAVVETCAAGAVHLDDGHSLAVVCQCTSHSRAKAVQLQSRSRRSEPSGSTTLLKGIGKFQRYCDAPDPRQASAPSELGVIDTIR